MPLLTQFQPEEGFLIGIWHCTEDAGELLSTLLVSPSDHQRFNAIQNPSRKRQWVGCRAALATLLETPRVLIGYNTNGKPELPFSGTPISFSHTKKYAAVILSRSHETGIDIEEIRPNIERVANRFLSVNEQAFIRPENQLFDLSLCWTIKEAVFKIPGTPAIDLLEDINIESIDYLCGLSGQARAILRQPESTISVPVSFLQLANFILSWTHIPGAEPGN